MMRFIPVLLALALCDTAMANPETVKQLLDGFRAEGAADFSAQRGEAFWDREFRHAGNGQKRRCSDCHSTDLRRIGEHVKTGKKIEPLAPSVNPKRLTDIKHIKKWLYRNCKWTLGRECTSQEKGDVLLMIESR